MLMKFSVNVAAAANNDDNDDDDCDDDRRWSTMIEDEVMMATFRIVLQWGSSIKQWEQYSQNCRLHKTT